MTRIEDKLLLKTNGSLVFVPMDEIDCLQADGNTVRVYRGKDVFRVRDSLSNMENRIDTGHFVRISRFVVVNLNSIQQLKTVRPNAVVVVLDNGMSWNWGRGYRMHLKLLKSRFITGSALVRV